MGREGGRRCSPFAAAVFKHRTVPSAVEPPEELVRAQLIDSVLQRWPGYTIRTLMEEDAHELYQTLTLLNPDLGKADG